MTSTPTFDVLTMTDEARNVVLDALANEEMNATLALWIEVTGTMGAGYSYDLYFSDLNDAPVGVESALAKLAIQVLDDEVNPSIASHGGRADLVALDDERKVAYIKMSGGCQGCSMSRMTLSQGIETALRSAIPELNDVRDVTDHA